MRYYMGDVKTGKIVVATYKSDPATIGGTYLAIHWAPRDPEAEPADPDAVWVHPGQTHQVQMPESHASAARSVLVDVDLPDGNGRGTLTVESDGELVAKATITKDTFWKFGVI